jgi:purine-nucleoside phosphorylase
MPTQPTRAAARYLRRLCPGHPQLAIVLGSAFPAEALELDTPRALPYSALPGFPQPGVQGHSGHAIAGSLHGVPLLILSGRCHFYEGHSLETVTFPIRALAALGVDTLLLTNAAGAINRRLRRGDFLLLTDHINFLGQNPLRGSRAPDPLRFLDLSQVYDPALGRLLRRAARTTRVALRGGTYIAVSGPTYETPAEIRAFARLGADAVGMSTVPEAIVARQHRIAVAALSCVTNLAAGRSAGTLSHAEVLAAGRRVRAAAAQLLKEFCAQYAHQP